jgi:hypothetical protein
MLARQMEDNNRRFAKNVALTDYINGVNSEEHMDCDGGKT